MASGVGPKEGPEAPDAKKSKKSVDADAFKDMMGVGKAREVDPDEQRKRKSRQETEADVAGMAEAGGVMPGVTPQATPETEDTFKIDVSNLSEAPPSAASTPDEYSEEEISSTPSYSQEETPLPSEGFVPQLSDEEISTTKEPQQAEGKGKAKKGKKKGTEEVIKPPQLKKAKIETQLKKVSKPATPPKKGAIFPEKKEVFPEKLKGTLPTKEEVKEAAEEMEPPITALPLGSWERVKEESEEKKGIESVSQAVTPAMPDIFPLGFEAPPVSTLPPGAAPFTQFPAMWDLFDRMVGVMSVMTDSRGITETTINLTSDQFKSSPFYGTQIIVREFSTAPREFNIEMHVPTQVIGQIQANYNELVAAFEAGKYNFKVNRIELSQLTGRKEEEKKKVPRIKKTKKEQ